MIIENKWHNNKFHTNSNNTCTVCMASGCIKISSNTYISYDHAFAVLSSKQSCNVL